MSLLSSGKYLNNHGFHNFMNYSHSKFIRDQYSDISPNYHKNHALIPETYIFETDQIPLKTEKLTIYARYVKLIFNKPFPEHVKYIFILSSPGTYLMTDCEKLFPQTLQTFGFMYGGNLCHSMINELYVLESLKSILFFDHYVIYSQTDTPSIYHKLDLHKLPKNIDTLSEYSPSAFVETDIPVKQIKYIISCGIKMDELNIFPNVEAIECDMICLYDKPIILNQLKKIIRNSSLLNALHYSEYVPINFRKNETTTQQSIYIKYDTFHFSFQVIESLKLDISFDDSIIISKFVHSLIASLKNCQKLCELKLHFSSNKDELMDLNLDLSFLHLVNLEVNKSDNINITFFPNVKNEFQSAIKKIDYMYPSQPSPEGNIECGWVFESSNTEDDS